MRVTFDSAKCEKTLAERGLDFADAALVFADRHVFSMRKANEREQARIAPLLEVRPRSR